MIAHSLPLLQNPGRAIRTPPGYCQCARGVCDQDYKYTTLSRGTFLYPSTPSVIANTIEGAVKILEARQPKHTWRSWKDFAVAGQTIFCEICRRMRFSDFIVADVTTLNFNLLFEIGYALGLDLPVVPIRDVTYEKHMMEFDELGLLDTLGYLNFQNANELANAIIEKQPFQRNAAPLVNMNSQQPLYVVKGPLSTDSEVKLLAVLAKSMLRFRMFDPRETQRLSLHEARRQVGMSFGVVTHLLSPERKGALVHNARCALVTGLATAAGKAVFVMQEEDVAQPIDYRDLVTSYKTPEQLSRQLQPFFNRVIEQMQDGSSDGNRAPSGLLEQLDLGDPAAENEIQALKNYFVQTAQFQQAKRASGRLVTGRKGSGKTAVFYAVRDSIPKRPTYLVLDLKPEGYQFSKLREAVLSKASEGMQDHTLMAFWEYILLCEIAQRVTDVDFEWAQLDEERRRAFEIVKEIHSEQPSADQEDFSERLLKTVDILVERFSAKGSDIHALKDLTAELFRETIPKLQKPIALYLREKEQVWVLFDNLDKAWPVGGATPADTLIIRTLLDATRKLQRQFAQHNVVLNTLVFLRNDIHDLLVKTTSDRGKDTQISLDWDDPELLKEIIRQRILRSVNVTGDFDTVWRRLFDGHVGVRDSFGYILDRTFMRPRDLLNFLRRATEIAINRGHDRVLESDIVTAEKSYSEDLFVSTAAELRDISSAYEGVLYAFLRQSVRFTPEELSKVISSVVPSEIIDQVIQILVWFGFLGVQEESRDEPVFAYQQRYNVEKLLVPIRRGQAFFVVHPAFHPSLQ